MRALIVDDSAVMRKVVERSLTQAGLPLDQVLQAGNGLEALTILRAAAEPFDLILTDINMPVMDGLQFLKQCHKEALAPGTPIVILTTEGSEPLVLQALEAGADGYICKPFTPDHIKARLLPLLLASAIPQSP